MKATTEKRLFPYLLLLPTIIVMATVVAYPFVYNFMLSFKNMSMYHYYDAKFVGFRHYAGIFTQRELYWVFGKTVARVIISTRTLYTLPLGLESLSSTFQTEWANYAAGSVLVSLPVVLLFLFLNRFFVSGLTLGGVKQ